MRQENKNYLRGKGARVFSSLSPVVDDMTNVTNKAAAPALGAANAVNTSAFPDVSGIKMTVLSVETISDYGKLYVDFLKARREVFIDEKGWGLPEVDGMEFDQYDTPFSRWVVIHEYGEILAGVRMMPTTAQCGIYSYMLRDAQLGLLDSIPREVLFIEAPVKKSIWEASRLFITNHVPARRRAAVQDLLMKGMLGTAVDNGASHVIGIVPVVWSRWLRRMNLKGFPAGPRMQFGREKSQAVLLRAAPLIH